MRRFRRPALLALTAAVTIASSASAVPGAAATTRQHRAVRRCAHGRSAGRTRVRARCAVRHSASSSRPSASYPPAPHKPAPAAASSGPCIGMTDVPTPANIAEVQAATLCLVNAVRAHFGHAPLVANAALAKVALQHSQDEIANDYFDHTGPSGQTYTSRIAASGYLSGAWTWSLGENIAWGERELTTPLAMVIAWYWSPSHRANMLSDDFHDTGIGVVASAPASLTDVSPAATYTEEFGAVE